MASFFFGYTFQLVTLSRVYKRRLGIDSRKAVIYGRCICETGEKREKGGIRQVRKYFYCDNPYQQGVSASDGKKDPKNIWQRFTTAYLCAPNLK